MLDKTVDNWTALKNVMLVIIMIVIQLWNNINRKAKQQMEFVG